MKTFLNLLYVASFIALLAIMGHRNAEIDRWIYAQEIAREIMMADEAETIEMIIPVEIGSASL